jgi:hypothetical protein
MADTTVKIKLTGPAVAGGAIELRRLVQFGERLQKAVDRIAYALEKQSGSRRKLAEVRQDTALRLMQTSEGSFAAEFNFMRPPILFKDYYDIATLAMTHLVSGLEYLQVSENGHLPEGYDQGVLIVLDELGKTLDNGIDAMLFDVLTPNQHLVAVYDKYTHSRIVENISEPEEKIAAVTGRLLMINFVKDRYRCHLFLDETNYIPCTFDEDTADVIERTLRHEVYVVGIATMNPVNDEIARLHIKQVVVLDEENIPPQQLAELLDAYIVENDTLAGFREGWSEALAGETRPISELWDDIDAD